jgi:ribA/ribD-fused uncharacterized protein
MTSDHDFPLCLWDKFSCISFRKTGEKWGGLSNMAAGYPITVNAREWRTSEALYQALRFPDHPSIQGEIWRSSSPMAAKMKTKPHRIASSRADWDAVRVDLMYWCIHAKLVCNFDSFGALLRETLEADIVEDSHRDRFWGAVAVNDEHFQGRNVLGELLMRLRAEHIVGGDRPAELRPPSTPGCRLMGEEILTIYPVRRPPNTLF